MIFAGGVPLELGGKVAGAIGVSGGSAIRTTPLPKPTLRHSKVFSWISKRDLFSSNPIWVPLGGFEAGCHIE